MSPTLPGVDAVLDVSHGLGAYGGVYPTPHNSTAMLSRFVHGYGFV